MFKSLLFLGAGSVILAVNSNDMKDMGGLRKHLPITHVTFLIACLAIAGIPPLSGFVSKDEIVTAAYQFSTGMGIWMTVTAGFTAFYMFRLYFRIFWGKEYRGEVKPKESPRSMTYPLIFLALITLVGGFIPFGQFVTADGAPYTIRLNSTVAIISVVVALVGIGLATLLYRKEEKRQAGCQVVRVAFTRRLTTASISTMPTSSSPRRSSLTTYPGRWPGLTAT